MAEITYAQWQAVVFQGLGIRSGTSAGDYEGAAYAMDLDKDDPRPSVPATWSGTLDTTLGQILLFPDAANRYLLIVKPCAGGAPDYPGCFPKNVAAWDSAIAHVAIGQQTADQLANWVVANIPAEAAA